MHNIIFFLVLDEIGGRDGEVLDGRVGIASNAAEDLAESDQSLKLDVFDEYIRNVGVVKEDAIECQGSSVVNCMGKILDK